MKSLPIAARIYVCAIIGTGAVLLGAFFPTHFVGNPYLFIGLLLLSKHYRAPDRLHYAYGTFALLAVLAPWLYAPDEPRRRLLWFAGATLVAAALAVRAYLTA